MEYYTLMFKTGFFLNMNPLCDDTHKISDAIRFETKEHAREYLKNLRDDIGLKVAKVKIQVEFVD